MRIIIKRAFRYHVLNQHVNGQELFRWAFENKKPLTIEAILTHADQVDPTADDNLAIRLSSLHGHVDVVKLLLEWVGPNGGKLSNEFLVTDSTLNDACVHPT